MTETKKEDDLSVEDLGLKIGSKERQAWADILNRAEEGSNQAKREILMNEVIIELAKAKIREEKEKFK